MRIGFIARPREADFEFAALKQIPCLELALDADLTPLDRAPEVANWVRKYDVAVSCVSLSGRSYVSDDPAEQAAALRGLERVVAFAAAVKAKVATTGSSLHPALTPEAGCSRLADAFSPILQHAQEVGVRLAVSNAAQGSPVTGPDAWEPLSSALPALGIAFDPSAPLRSGQDWAAQLAAWGSRVVHVHANDLLFVAGRPFEDVPAGLGEIAWGRLFALLHHHRYPGDLTVRPSGPTWGGEHYYSAALLARRHLCRFLAPSPDATVDDVLP